MNSIVFDSTKPSEIKHFNAQLKVLIDYNMDSENVYFNDIHIKQEEDLIILEWERTSYSEGDGGKWVFVEEDEAVMKEVYFPDNHCEYLFPEEVNERFDEWLKEQAKAGEIWEKTPYGTWRNKTENERWKKLVGEEDEDKEPEDDK